MFRRALIAVSIGAALVAATGCTSKKVSNPIANVDSKQPDKVLFDRAMDAMKHEKFDVARVTLQTLINTYPDSEYIARAKLAIGDAWYAEGGSAAMSQAENEYKDFQTFFPNMPEAAEAQMKIAKIHYDEMEKADRDYTHAKRAEEEYRQMILQYPDSKLIPQAKQRLLEVQEILAQREYNIGRFYFLKEEYPASIARLKTLTDTYPLYSGADQALYMLGEAYQAEAEMIRKVPSGAPQPGKKVIPEAQKAAMIKQFEKSAADAYSRIVSRYPAMGRAEAAKKKLAELHYPVPTPTPEAIAENKAEQKSRSRQTKKDEMTDFLHHRPDTSEAAKVGEPTMVDPPITSAVAIVQSANASLAPKPGEAPKTGGAVGSTGTGGVSLETTGTGPAPANQPVPRSDNGATDGTTTAPVETGTPTPTAPSTSGGASSTTLASPAPAAATTNSTAPAAGAAPAPAPTRVNDADTSSSSGSSDTANAQANSDSSPTSAQDSSSKKKKKHGLAKLNPF